MQRDPRALGRAIRLALQNYFEKGLKTIGNSTVSQLLSSMFREQG